MQDRHVEAQRYPPQYPLLVVYIYLIIVTLLTTAETFRGLVLNTATPPTFTFGLSLYHIVSFLTGKRLARHGVTLGAVEPYE